MLTCLQRNTNYKILCMPVMLVCRALLIFSRFISLCFLVSGGKKISNPPFICQKILPPPPCSIHTECSLKNRMHDDFACVSQFLWNLKFVFSGSLRIFSLELFHITYYIYSPWKVYKRMRYDLIYPGTCTWFLSTAT